MVYNKVNSHPKIYLFMPFSFKLYWLLISLSGLLLFISTDVFSQTQYLDAPLAPPSNQTSNQAQNDEPEELRGSGIITRKLGNNTLEEYRVSGRTRSVKVTPGQGTLIFSSMPTVTVKSVPAAIAKMMAFTGWRIMNW